MDAPAKSILVQQAIAVLGNDALEIYWDDYWSVLERLDVNDIECTSALLGGFNNNASSAILFSVEGLKIIGFQFSRVSDRLTQLLKHTDYEVKLCVLKLIASQNFFGMDFLPALSEFAHDCDQSFSLRARACWILFTRVFLSRLKY